MKTVVFDVMCKGAFVIQHRHKWDGIFPINIQVVLEEILERRPDLKGKHIELLETKNVLQENRTHGFRPKREISDIDFGRHVWEGWCVRDFIRELEPQLDMVMHSLSWNRPITNLSQLRKWCMDNQPYYKRYIPEVVSYFARKYSIR